MRSWLLICACAVVVPSLGLMPLSGCGGNNSQTGFGDDGGGGGSSGGGSGGGGSGGSSGGSGGSSGGLVGDSSTNPNGPPLIYAHTDSELYSMDPMTHVLTDIGPFTTGGGSAPTITDLAVDANDDVWVNSESAIYKVTLPASGTGPVNITLQTQLGTGTKFYALGFTPAGTLESGESLIAGDSAGNLYYVDASGASATPQLLGGFGGNWELSGDVVFYTSNGATLGLATIRSCSGSCTTTNDSLAVIDVAAMQSAFQSKSASSSLLKQVLGSGTGYGDLFGLGAWGNSAYAFSRGSSSGKYSPQLVQIDSSGNGTLLQSFSGITNGWSGAGVTTKAMITVVTAQ
jgi:hypothetical protein